MAALAFDNCASLAKVTSWTVGQMVSLKSAVESCSMNDLYGVDPAAPASMLEFVSLMRFFGPGEGRFIADFPGHWIHDVSQHIKSFSQLEQVAALELWVRYGRSALLPTAARYNKKWSWSENSTNLSEHVVKLIGTKGCPATLVPIERALLDPSVFPDARGGHFPRTAHCYATVARPLLQTSSKIVLVDPYLKFRTTIKGTNSYRHVSRFRETLDVLFREAVKWKRVECLSLQYRARRPFTATLAERNLSLKCGNWPRRLGLIT